MLPVLAMVEENSGEVLANPHPGEVHEPYAWAVQQEPSNPVLTNAR